MIDNLKTFILGVGEIPALLEQEFSEILVEPEEGYYRFNDLTPVLPYRNNHGLPASYWIQEGILGTRREVNNLSNVKGVVFDDEGVRRMRLYRLGDLQPHPQLPVTGHRIVKEYLNSFIELSRCWHEYTDHAYLGTGSLYRRFQRFVKPEVTETFDQSKLEETPQFLAEVCMEYLRGRIAIPGQEHVFSTFLNRMVKVCCTMIQPIADHIVNNPWAEFEIQRIQSNDFLVIEKGDFRINQWEAQRAKKTGV